MRMDLKEVTFNLANKIQFFFSWCGRIVGLAALDRRNFQANIQLTILSDILFAGKQ